MLRRFDKLQMKYSDENFLALILLWLRISKWDIFVKTCRRCIREDVTSVIPYIVRSSNAYKRKAFLDLMTMFREYGASSSYGF